MKPQKQKRVALACLAALCLYACDRDNDKDTSTDTTDDTTDGSTTLGAIDINRLEFDALAEEISTVSCTLSIGVETECYSVTIKGSPRTTTADDAGIWLDGSGTVYQADGDFILDLANIYGQ